MTQQLEPWFEAMLCCPLSKAPLVRLGDWLYSTDPKTRRRYPIEGGIPKMLIDESEEVSEQEFEQVVAGKARSETEHGEA